MAICIKVEPTPRCKNWLAVRQRRSQEFDLSGYKWVKETKQPHKKFKVD